MAVTTWLISGMVSLGLRQIYIATGRPSSVSNSGSLRVTKIAILLLASFNQLLRILEIATSQSGQNKMFEIHNTQSQASSQSSSSSSASVTNAHIVDEVLNTRRRFRRDIGRKLSKFASSTRCAPPDFPPLVPEDVQ
ncbi:hypothetical protein PanWU01x14_034100 [Parasponia andersonii]|uniref:Uncharacterized protein n=1 Tax=Parasponia andersonii TaxID=3476 RepID=A0A2P5DTW1_PARAD|nr:hypothetical protein PanWU01x14_034100 [Parasponia andersonii]